MTHRFLLAAGLLAALAGCAGAKVGRLPELPPPPKDGAVTFVILGDNRGDEEGHQQQVFLDILRMINQAAPQFVVTTGDMVNGYTEDEAQLRRQWAGYKDAVKIVQAPILHTPGNHDLHDKMSARVYREMWGPTRWSRDFGPVRVIGLDTETDSAKIAGDQLAWLEKQLATAGKHKVFLALHQPLYPVDGHIGGSLDIHPEDRDRLHALFVKHKDRIGAVFAGHEHLYSYEERDGVKYYITGGAGAHLYAPREQGGFYHFLSVQVLQDGKI
ncbi:MAG: metallophosphoesterase, partial [bacterium]